MTANEPVFDVNCFGRSAVKLYGGYVGGRLCNRTEYFQYEAQQWVAGKIDDQTAQDMTSTVFETLVAAWDNAVGDR